MFDKSTPIPERMKSLPVDKRGFPIPKAFLIKDGVPDFAVLDPNAVLDLAERGCCAICGTEITHRLWFIGGDLAYANHLFTDGPMHYECADYATKVCPFLALSSKGYGVAKKHAPDVTVIEGMSDIKPKFYYLVSTTGCQVEVKDGHVRFIAGIYEYSKKFKYPER